MCNIELLIINEYSIVKHIMQTKLFTENNLEKTNLISESYK